MPDPDRNFRRLVLTAVYVATPLFLAMDWAADLNLRTAFLEDRPGWKWGYYGLLAVIGGILVYAPILARPLATVEAGANALLTGLTVFMPYVETLRSVEAGQEPIAMPEFPLAALLTSIIVVGIAQAPTVRRGPAAD